MKITFLSPAPNLAGGQRVVAIYADRLRRRGHQVRIVATPAVKPSPRSIFRSLIRGLGWPKAENNEYSHFADSGVPLDVVDRFRPLRDADVPDGDVVVATWWETAEWAAALSPRKGAKIHFLQDYEVWGGPIERVDATNRLPMPKIIIAKWFGDLLSSRFGVEDFTLIPNSVDLSMFHAEPRGKREKPTVGLVYTTFFNKGTDVCLEAYRLARMKIPDLRLVAFSGTPAERELPLPEGCDFGLRVPNERLRDYYSRCDAWLFGTRIEGFGLPILEAMACRTPVIGTPAGAAPELIAGGGGVLVRPEDPADMARAIERVVTLPDAEWRAMSDAAHLTASRYSWDDATDLFEAALRRCVVRD